MRSGPARGMRRKGGLGFLPNTPSQEEAFLGKLDFKGQVVYDLGANIGVLSLFFSRAVGADGFVYAFEPNPDTQRAIKDNFSVNQVSNIQLFQVAVGDSNGEATLVVHKGQRGRGSMNPPKVKEYHRKGENVQYAVRTVTLDSFVQEQKMRPPDFIKIDVEGFEYQVLSGAQSMLEQYEPKLFIEMHGPTDAERIKNAQNVYRFLANLGYKIIHPSSGEVVSEQELVDAKLGHIYCLRSSSN